LAKTIYLFDKCIDACVVALELRQDSGLKNLKKKIYILAKRRIGMRIQGVGIANSEAISR
jgi:hypothetical protein